MLQAQSSDFGVLLTPAGGRRLGLVASVRHWAFDNGCYSAGPAFDLDGYCRFVRDHLAIRRDPLFVPAPDVVGDWGASWQRTRASLPALRGLGVPVAVVAQDGVRPETYPWSEADVLFIGGTSGFKESATALALVQEAKARGIWAHVGRVNTRRRILMAYRMGADSCDGTVLRFVPDKWFPILRRWVGEANDQMLLPGLA